MNKTGRTLSIIFISIGGFALLIYPLVLLGNIMQLAAERTGNENSFLMLIVYLFIIVSSSYILTYIICLIFYFIFKNKRLLISIIPLVHLAVSILLLFLWFFSELVLQPLFSNTLTIVQPLFSHCSAIVQL